MKEKNIYKYLQILTFKRIKLICKCLCMNKKRFTSNFENKYAKTIKLCCLKQINETNLIIKLFIKVCINEKNHFYKVVILNKTEKIFIINELQKLKSFN